MQKATPDIRVVCDARVVVKHRLEPLALQKLRYQPTRLPLSICNAITELLNGFQ